MRKKIVYVYVFFYIFFICFLLSSEETKVSYIKNIDFGIDSNFYIKENKNDSTYSFLENGKIIFRGLDFCVKYKNPSSTFSNGIEYESNNFFWKSSLFFDELIKIPLSISFGNLGFSGSISKLNTPTISSGLSCFGSSIASSSGISIGNSCIYESSLSVAYKYNLLKKKELFRKLDFVYFFDEKGNWAESFSFDFRTKKNFVLSFAQTVGMFFVENKTSSWFCKTDLFPLGNLYFGNIQFYFDSSFYKCRFLSSIYQTNSIIANKKLFNDDLSINFTFSFENLIKFSFFSINIDCFLADSTTIFTPTSSNLKTIFQLKANPVFTFIIFNNTARMRVGGVFYIDEKLDSNINTYFSYKWSSGVNVNWKKSSVRLLFTSDSQKYSLLTSASFQYGIKPFVNLGFVFWLPSDSNQDFEKIEIKSKFSMNINSKSKNLFFYLNNSCNLVFENQITSVISELSFSIKKRFEYITFKSSIGIKFKFL